MKKVIVIFLLCAACSHPTLKDRAIAGVKKYLNDNLNDPSSYQPIEFSGVENDDSARATIFKRYSKEDMKDPLRRKDAITGLEMMYPANYAIYHKYRAKNAMGALILNEEVFFLDSTMKVVKVREQ